MSIIDFKPTNINLKIQNNPTREKLGLLLQSDFDFHNEKSNQFTHTNHAFPAKFPPQLPSLFIQNLTSIHDIVLDPMMGSGTTLLEASINKRIPIGFDIDPLAANISFSKIYPFSKDKLESESSNVIALAKHYLQNEVFLEEQIKIRFSKKSREFVEYWFSSEVQKELIALLSAIDALENISTKKYLLNIFSAIIITKSGGVSLARDLAHTRPHKVEKLIEKSPIQEFQKRLKTNVSATNVTEVNKDFYLAVSNAENLPLSDSIIDLIVTSPPYANNAIDYMRASKFSLVWLGYDIDDLTNRRSKYIGNHRYKNSEDIWLPLFTQHLVNHVQKSDRIKGQRIKDYFLDMYLTIEEMYRVLKPGKAAIIVVGSSIISGVDVNTHKCIADIGEDIGFDLVGIAERDLDRNRRMMPARFGKQMLTQIEQRMNSEFIIGLIKPEGVL